LLDNVLTTCLIVLVPAFMLGRSLYGRNRPPASKLGRYASSIAMAFGLLALLAADWRAGSRHLAALGFDFPLSMGGLIGLGLAACLLAGFTLSLPAQMKSTKGKIKEAQALTPTTRSEFIVFSIFCIVAGCAWEVLYRGYLLWALPPKIGLIGGIVVAAAAYGAAHGYKNLRQFAGSLISAFLFVIAYALTKSLWWLILLHCSLPMLSVVAISARNDAAARTDAFAN
jgi:membrane protease YdiL (CAAX protease family)